MNKLLLEDILEFGSTFPLAKELKGTKFLITGATGLIGSTIVRCLLGLNEDIQIVCPVRNLHKAENMFASCKNVFFVESDLMDFVSKMEGGYIIHCASPTAGKYMIAHPVETYELAIESTRLLLKIAKNTHVKSLVYVSSLEYYGQITECKQVTENDLGYVDASSSRSSYPLGKRAAEYLCTSYAQEYGVEVRIARLTQTFGVGVATDDNRVFAQFARSIIADKDIIMHTSGDSSKPYCYTTDCVSAILHILLKGKRGEAYNVANSSTYISIRDMAYFLRDNFNPKINVKIELHPEMGYAPVTMLNLSTEKLESLGWKPHYDLKEMFEKLIRSIRYED